MMQQPLATTKYVFELEKSPLKKGDCPNCKHKNCFRYYKHLPHEYGICDHANTCNYHHKPSEQLPDIKKVLYNMVNNALTVIEPIQQKKTVVPSEEQLSVLNHHNSVFHSFCMDKLSITKEHLQCWNVGTDNRGNTAFVLQDITGKHINIKFIEYILTDNNCKRNKNKNPYYLKVQETEQYKKCLFGEHLITKDKITCIVESEKTAVICAFIYPQYNWVATGGNNGVKVETLSILKGLQVHYLADNDNAGNNNSILTKLQLSGIDFKKVCFETAKESEDLADLLIRGERPDIRPSHIPSQTILQQIVQRIQKNQQENNQLPQMQEVQKTHQEDAPKETQSEIIQEIPNKSKNISDFEKVENFIAERYDIRNNTISNKIEYRVKNSDNNEFRELNENNIFRELQKNFINFSINKLKSMLGSDFVKEFNPFMDYFKNLPNYDPNTEPDYILQLCGYVPAKDKTRFEIQFKKMLVRSIACSLHNVINKQAFVLVHDEQHGGKTTFLRWLNPPTLKNYIAENINTDKDSLIAMCTNFIINMDELATLNKAEINALKSIMSKDVFKGRLPYGAREINLTRRANIVGSTNNTEFLSDETGSVRWLCFELVEKLNFNYKKDVDIDTIWAQAYHLYKSGFKYELTPAEIIENETANANHRIITTEQELIQATFTPSSKNALGSIFKCATEIKIILAEKYPTERLSNLNNIGKALKVLGFKKETSKTETDKPYPIKGYHVTFKS
jgi:predicted P-loop ATPase